MEIQFYGGNCVRLSVKKSSVVVDDNLAELGQKSVTKAGDIALFTAAHGNPGKDIKLTLDQPGEYEVAEFSIQGIAARAHMDEAGQLNTTMFKVMADDVKVAIVGHIYPELSSAQLEALGMIDVLIIPVGGHGYTLDSVGASHIIKEIEPKLVIPTHYSQDGLQFPVPQQDLPEALKGLGMEPKETVAKLKVKGGELGDTMQLVVLER